MLSCLELQNYRGFKQYKLSGLTRVNLLVGKNNSGKTSILEAVNLLASGGDIRVLARIARQRGEVLYDPDEREPRRTIDISHFFYGHEFGPQSRFTLRSDDGCTKIDFYIVSVVDSPEEGQRLLFDEGASRSGLGVAVRIEGERYPSLKAGPAIPVSEDGGISFDLALRVLRSLRGKIDEVPIQIVTQDSLERSSMSEMWDKVITEGKEEEVVKAMQILEPKLTSIAFLSGERTYRLEPRGGIVAGFEGTQRRHPLGSYGEGMRRLLALSLSLARSQNGILLIDEIDTGLHYSIMGDMWLLVGQAAQRYNIQVFATTHSFDCVRGLDWLCRHHPELEKAVSLQKIEHELDEAVSLDAEQIKIAVEQDIEVR
ncbi:MAG: AAA family ATPase [Isosphaeraceae bacterium]